MYMCDNFVTVVYMLISITN